MLSLRPNLAPILLGILLGTTAQAQTSRQIVPGDVGIQTPFGAVGDVLVAGPTTSQIQDSANAAAVNLPNSNTLSWGAGFLVQGANLTPAGSPIYQNGALIGTTGAAGVQALNMFQWNDNVNAGTNSLSYLWVHDHLNGSSVQGNRYAITSQVRMDTTPSSSDPSIKNYVAVQANAIATVPAQTGLGGGGLYSGYVGSLWGADDNVFLSSGATNWTYIAGHEIGVAIPTGASAADRWGLVIYSAGNLPGNIDDAAISLGGGADTNGLWKNGVEFGGVRHNWPILSTGCMICAVNRTQGGSTTLSAATGMDISAVTISGNAFASAGFTVDGSGKLTAYNAKLGHVYTVATLPTCNGGAEGTFAAVSDASAPTYNATVAGGGAVHIPVYCNGTNWTAH
jgi:hypothetical protein